MSKLKSSNKPFEISKRAVWEAYQRVKAKHGAAGVDGQTIAEFEEDLKGNLRVIQEINSTRTIKR
jgi:RNA-directed DNA polymerase